MIATAAGARTGTRSVQPAADGLGAAAFAGWTDLLGVRHGAAVEIDDLASETLLRAPGIELRVDRHRVDWHATRGALTLVVGRPLLDGKRAPAEAIERALAATSLPWPRIGGRYAIVRVDLATAEVLLATDRFAVWPLCWTRDRTRIAFADRADAVPAGREPAIDPQALFDYLYFHVVPAPRTIFANVQRVPPATAVRVGSVAVLQEATWRPQFAHTRRPADTELQQRFRRTITQAVLDEADAAAPGCFLSGGTDSSTVAGVLAGAFSRASTFSIGFAAEGYDEMSYARITAKHFGTQHHEYYVTPADVVRAAPLVARHYDQPFGNSSAVPAYYCALMARHHGVARLLAGDGGDELFGGNVRYARQKMFEWYHALPQALRRRTLEPLLMSGAARMLPGVRKASSYVSQARMPMPARTETYNLLQRFGAADVFSPEFLRQVDGEAPARLQSEVYARHPDAALVDRMLAYDWRFTLADNDLPKITGTTQLAGVASAFPLLADALLDLSLELAPEDKLRGLRLRHFFKEALTDFLPKQVIEKRKHGFGLPIGPWLVADVALRALARDALLQLAARGLIRPQLADDLFSRRLEAHPAYYGQMIWVLMMLELWLAAHAPRWSCR